MIYEILAILVVVGFIANGVRAGSVETLGRLVGSVFGFLAARAWSHYLVTFLSLFLPLPWASLVGFLFVFLVVDNFIGFIFKLGETIFKVITQLPIIKQIDGLIGGVLGFLEAIIVVGGVSYLIRTSPGAGTLEFVSHLWTVKTMDTLFQMFLFFLV